MKVNSKIFLKNRFSRQAFTGLPLTIFVIIFFILLGTFIGLTDFIVTSSPIVKIDFSFAHFLYQHRNPTFQNIFYYITRVADQSTVITLLIIFAAYLWFKTEKAFLYSALVVAAGDEITVSLVKNLINRTRPALDPTYFVEKAKSFPSGHSAIAVAFFGFVTYYLVRHISKRNYRSVVIILGLFLVLLIGFSRLYLGVHYLSDVLGGFLIGALWLVVGIIFRERHFYTSSIKKEKIKL